MGSSVRFEDWPERLIEFFDSRQGTPFAWGTHDCATFALASIEALTGVRHTTVNYNTELGARKYLRKHGSLSKQCLQYLGGEINPLMAQRGDIVLVLLNDGEEALAVCGGDALVGPSRDVGLVYLPLSCGLKAWRV